VGRSFLRRQKAIEADENRRTNMAVQMILEKELLDHSDDDMDGTGTSQSKRKNKRPTAPDNSAQPDKRGKTSNGNENQNSIGSDDSLSSGATSDSQKARKSPICAESTGLQSEKSFGDKKHKAATKTYGTIHEDASSEDIEDMSDCQDGDSGGDDRAAKSSGSSDKTKPASSLIGSRQKAKNFYSKDEEELLLIDKILAIRMKSPPVVPHRTVPGVEQKDEKKLITDAIELHVEVSKETDHNKESSSMVVDTAIANNATSSGSNAAPMADAEVPTSSSIASTSGNQIVKSEKTVEDLTAPRVSTRELLVKYFGKSYRSLAWVDEEKLKSTETGENKLKGFLRVFKKKGEPPLDAVTADSAPFSLETIVDYDWLEVERVVAIYEESIGAAGSLNRCREKAARSDSPTGVTSKGTAEIAFVKWRGLGYSECTWERWSEVQNEELLIAQCRAKDLEVEAIAATKRLEKALKGSKKSLSDKNRASFLTGKSLGREDIPVRNVSLRDYQLEGINWLLFQWTQSRSCLLADEMGLGEGSWIQRSVLWISGRIHV
jgi:Chromo (CHRromatin Organisation MOdifier) domain